MQPGSSSKTAEERNVVNYSALNDGFKFQPVAVKTSGVFDPSSMKFLEYSGSKITKKTSDKRDTEHLFQRIILVVMRSNAYSVIGVSRWLK